MNAVNSDLVKKVLISPDPNSHKGENGRILIIGGSPLFHGADQLSVSAVMETLIGIGSRLNDMVYVCSTDEILSLLKGEFETFIAVKRKQVKNYIDNVDVILCGPGLMREKDLDRPDTKKEPEFTKYITLGILKTNKKQVLDAGSLQVLTMDDIRNKPNLIITPHRKEMANLFNIDSDSLRTFHDSTKPQIEKISKVVFEIAFKLNVTILLKGPVDIIASKDGWLFNKGGNAGMTKGGTGDVLAGVVAAFYSRYDNPLEVAAAASFITKKAGEQLWRKKLWIYNSTDLIQELSSVILTIIRNEQTLSYGNEQVLSYGNGKLNPSEKN